ncbi:hypothetical protein [Bosea sp. (in: a-proteobacteria)]|uniref:hypothetical protein n=1 Tax=Bosea sp. (in: a-proteobacteria) TaxID=1871050 RepID=UPI002605DE51|nr:hypothetical protein [Bosea sp. (in: a-proteobacteria)]MCO5091037.1 DUF4091 domain-containing protein [Bosea sp. (in: a-proteobacteria)]
MAAPQNRLLGAAYRLDPAPNYALALARGGRELTDGHIGRGRIWTNGSAAGWSWRMPVTVALDLPQPASIDHVRIHTASGTQAGVYRPSQIVVFGGDGSGRFDFLAESPLGSDTDSSPSPVESSLDIRFPPHRISQILVVAFARGTFLFLSEIEAFEASSAGQEIGGGLPDLAAARQFAIEHRRMQIETASGPRPTGPDPARRWAMPLGADATAAPSPPGCAMEPIDPWTLRPAREAPRSRLVALTGGHDYAAWRVANRSATELSVNVDVAQAAGVRTRVLALAHAQALSRAWVPDVVTPFDGAVLPAGSAMLLLVETRPETGGSHRIDLALSCGEYRLASTLDLTAIPADPGTAPLHGNLWTYLHEPMHLPVARALGCDAGFLARYGVDTATVHPAALFDGGRERPTELLRRYLETHREAARILLYMDIKTRPWAFLKLPDEEAAAALRGWWDWVEATAKAARVSGEIILYPIDEPRPADLPAMKRFRALAHSAGIEARIYATLERGSLAILPFVDVAQLHRPAQPGMNLAGLPGRQERDGYDTREDAKLLSPDGYYRRQGWEAYALDLKGVGIWSAWDSTGLGDPASGWNPFTGRGERDFGLIYAAPDGCAWPSLRLLAWRRGVEENRLLRQCAKRLPEGYVEQMVRGVMDDRGTAKVNQAAVEVLVACER